MKLTVLCLFAALTAGAQGTTEHLPVADAEKIADALRAGPNFITDGATLVDYPAIKGGEFRILRKGSSEWTCLPGPPPGRMALPAGRSTSRDLASPTCIWANGFRARPAGSFTWEPTLWSSLYIQVICRVSPARGGTART